MGQTDKGGKQRLDREEKGERNNQFEAAGIKKKYFADLFTISESKPVNSISVLTTIQHMLHVYGLKKFSVVKAILSGGGIV